MKSLWHSCRNGLWERFAAVNLYSDVSVGKVVLDPGQTGRRDSTLCKLVQQARVPDPNLFECLLKVKFQDVSHLGVNFGNLST